MVELLVGASGECTEMMIDFDYREREMQLIFIFFLRYTSVWKLENGMN